METRVALLSIIVEKSENTDKVNEILHEYGNYIIGRMGIPYRKRGISIISVALEADNNTINTLAGKIGRIDGMSAKTVSSNSIYTDEG